MDNYFLDYYGKNKISPVNQDIGDIKLHYTRRKKLYRQCGIPVMAFKDKKLLEVGPGGGYNTIAFFHWGIGHVDLVEANPKGIEDMYVLFSEKEISQESYTIHQCMIEDYHVNDKYDIIIAEGFLPSIKNKKEVADKLKSLCGNNGIIVITCIDSIGFFIELIKRMLGQALSKDIIQYEDKVEYLSGIFGPQLAKLKGVSRPVKDWVQDQILNPALYDTDFSLLQAIDLFGDGYDILGGSPNMFTDYSWYKDVWFDYKEDYKRQFEKKQLSLLKVGMPEQNIDGKYANKVKGFCDTIKELEKRYEETFDDVYIRKIYDYILNLEELMWAVGSDFMKVFYEMKYAVNDFLKLGEVDFEKYPQFFSAFGRSQQYIAFEKIGD